MRYVLFSARRFRLFLALAGSLLPLSLAGAQEPDGAAAPQSSVSRPRKTTGFRIVDPVVCTSIDGYEEYEKHPDAKLTAEEKLLVYYRPKGFKVVHVGDSYIARFVQDGQIRRLGRKQVLLRKEKLLSYEAKSDVPPDEIYVRNVFSLKGLPPGDYEYDMILRDVAARPAVITTVESVQFQIIPPKSPESGPAAGTAPGPQF